MHVQQADEHLAATRWPPRGTRFRRLALGPGTLGRRAGQGTASFVTNPAAGFSLAFNKFGTGAASPYVPLDQRLEGAHGLTFRTEALERPSDLVGPTAYRLAAGHQLQLRVTSSDLPTHLPGSASVDRDRPQDARIDLHPPATNTIRFAGSHLLVPTRAPTRGTASRRAPPGR